MQGVFARRECQLCFKRTVPEMEVLLIGGNYVACGSEISIDKNVHVP